MPVTPSALARNAWRPATSSHIIPVAHPDAKQMALLIHVCPAGLFRQTADGMLEVDFHGCLECGSCRLLCQPEVLERWGYPASGFGIIYRFG